VIFLLDVNALLAYHYPTHVHHARVRDWASQLRAERGQDDVALATCPITVILPRFPGHPDKRVTIAI
jgi:predicted nucleic acid-binding protein